MLLGRSVRRPREQPLKPGPTVFPSSRQPANNYSRNPARCHHPGTAPPRLSTAPARTATPAGAERTCRTRPRRAGSRGTSRLRKGHDGRGLDALRACAKGATASCVVPFETSGGELLRKPLASLSAGWKRVPSSVGLAMALQLSREQGITLRGSAEIVAEFFCKFSSCEAEGGESRAQAARRPAARPERPRIPALVPRPPVPAGGIRKWGGGRRLRSCCFRQRRRPGRCRGPPCGGAPLRERFFPMQSSSHTPRPQRRVASRVDRDGLDFGKSCSELGQVYLLTEPGKTGEDKRRKERRGEACLGLVPVCQLPVLTPSNHKIGIWTCFTMKWNLALVD